MSAILGAFAATPLAPEAARRMLAQMARRGADEAEVWHADGAALGVSRFAWEMEPGFSGGVLVARDGALAAAADASLYYRDDLLRALAAEGVRPARSSPAHLILAAYRAWGEGCAERLEGDFAFVLWDPAERRVFCGRDPGGKRPLFWSEAAGGLRVASTISALLAHPDARADLNLVAVAADAAGLFAAREESCYRGVFVLPAGSSLVMHNGQVRTFRHWSAPPVRSRGGEPFEAATEQLRHLLRRATEERLAPEGPTSVWMSGGWDSTAVFAAAEGLLRTRSAGEHLRAVSISYPPGDPGREDELIRAVADFWNAPVHWLRSGDVPLLDRPEESAAAREEPFAHAFEQLNRALGVGSRAAGTRVAWDGNGGDQLFQVSDVYLADLLRTGRWLALRREWGDKELRGFPALFRWAIQPNLPPPLLAFGARLRGGRPLLSNLQRPLPDWIDSAFVRAHGLRERERRHTPERTGSSRAAYETHWYVTHPYFPRAFEQVAGFALEEGVEIRSPLLDRRIVEFALARPASDRSAGRETKRLLRAAGRGLLPDELLAPRAVRTGVTSGYFEREMTGHFAPFFAGVLEQPLQLAEAGIVRPDKLRSRWADYLRTGDGSLGIHLWLTLQTEIWLRTRPLPPTR